jgi:hypothetical protein
MFIALVQKVHSRGLRRRAIFRAVYQTPGIQQMLRPELPDGPSEARIELDPEKVSDIAVHAVTYPALELAFGVPNANGSLQGNGLIHLQTGS